MLNVSSRQKKLNTKEEITMRQRSISYQRCLLKMAQGILTSTVFIFLSFKSVFAQDGSGLGALFGGAILLYVLLFAVVIGVYIWMLVWVNNDAKQRGQSGCLPMALVFLFGPIGLIIWLLMRDSK